jgi:Flp pilus assembly protein TadB
MRLIAVLTAVVALAFAFATGAAEKERTVEKESKSVTLTLTKAQAEEIKNAKGKDVKIELTKSQINAIKNAGDVTNVVKTVTLNSTHLRTGDKIVVGWFPPDTIDDPVRMDPQPSP